MNGEYDVALLHSLSGPMEISERPLVNSSLLAFEEINSSGGVLGRKINVHVYDGASDPVTFNRATEDAVGKCGCGTFFGTWMSSSRKSVIPVLDKNGTMLWYPIQYEGLEISDNVVYTGSCLNQQIEPALEWCRSEKYTSYFLLGSNYVYPHTANYLISSSLECSGFSISGELYADLGEEDFSFYISRILDSGCDIVLNTLNGKSNIFFLEQLKKNLNGKKLSVLSFSLTEVELSASVFYENLYSCCSYFQSLDNIENKKFIENYKKYCRRNNLFLTPASDPVVTAYSQVFLWKKCVEAAGSFDIELIKKVLSGTGIRCPLGWLEICENHHVLREARIGMANRKGLFDIIHCNGNMIGPLPWLGIEKFSFPTKKLITDTIAKIPGEINYKIELKRKSVALEYEKQKYQHLVDNMSNGVAVYMAVDNGNDFIFVDYNRAGARMDGVERGKVIGKRLLEIFPAVKEFGLFDVIREVWETGKAVNHPVSLYSDNKLQAWRENYVYRLPTGEVVAVYNDVTEKMKIQDDLEHLNRRYSLAAESARLGVWELDLVNDKLVWDEWMFRLYHVLPDDFSSDYEAWKSSVHPDDLKKTESKIQDTIAGKGVLDTSFRIIIPGNNIRHIQAYGLLTVDDYGNPLRLTGVNYDITEIKEAEKRITELAIKDPLTGLFNRRYLYERLAENVEEYRRTGKPLSLAMIDIDNFKKINDSFGHSCGDSVLKSFSDILVDEVRPYDFISRYGGEEFVIVFHGVEKKDAAAVVSRILDIVRKKKLIYNSKNVSFTFSAGITEASEVLFERLSAENLINAADDLLYRAKRAGRDRIV